MSEVPINISIDISNLSFSSYWKHFVSINVEDIVYVHCHQAGGQDTGGTIILVEQDGIQRPPIHFPEGGHMSSFLSCLETGLAHQPFLELKIIQIQPNCRTSSPRSARSTALVPARNGPPISGTHWRTSKTTTLVARIRRRVAHRLRVSHRVKNQSSRIP